jgi:enoyl-CoA hydratase/carnithine racemase
MTTLVEYETRYHCVDISRKEGILQVALHTNGGPYVNSGPGHTELAHVFHDIAGDPDNRVMIFTGTGSVFCTESDRNSMNADTPEGWYRITQEAKQIIMGMLDIEVPVISVVNGPVNRHSELPLLGDIVLASSSATFQEGTHLPRMAPGDGMHIVWPYLIGDIRARYFLLTGQVISAEEAQLIGIVNEIHPEEAVLDRAWEIAGQLTKIPDLTLRYTRILLTQRIRQVAHDYLGSGLALEGLTRMGAPNAKYGTIRPHI